MAKSLPKIIVILGPTASGKSALAIDLAREFSAKGGSASGGNGEIVSADSRQVYRGLDIGTGKVTKKEQAIVPHHLLDIVEPMAPFSLAHYQKAALAAIDDTIARSKLPFLVGGTALYIYAVVDNYDLNEVGANLERRKELEKKTVEELQNILTSASPLLRGRLGGGLNEDDMKNPRRLIRAIEKLEAGASLATNKKPARYDALLLGIDVPRLELYKKIDQRMDERIKQGMIDEVINLRKNGVTDNWLLGLGLEYKWITKYLQDCQPKAGQPLAEPRDEMVTRLKTAIHAFSRRQMTWWKRDKRIVWIKNKNEAKKIIVKFLR